MSVNIRLTVGAVAAAAALSVVAAGPASAWPMPFTPEQQRFINQARNAGFPGDDDAVMQAHIDLYVTRHTLDLGDDGRAAVQEMFRIAREKK